MAHNRFSVLGGKNQKYFDADKLKAEYSTVPSQQNPNPVYSWRSKTAKKGGGHTYGEWIRVYEKDKPVAAPAPTPAPAAAPAPAPAPSPPPKPVPTKLSKEVATAIGRAEAFEDTVRPQYGNYLIGGDESVIDDFEKSATEKIEEASKPYFDDDVNRQDAQEYADKYKLMLGGGLTLTPIV